MGYIPYIEMNTETKQNEYKVYALKGVGLHGTWKRIWAVNVNAFSPKEAKEKVRVLHPDADKYNVFLMKNIIGDWSH